MEQVANNEKCGNRIIHMEKIEAARKNCLPARDLEDLSLLFRTLADPNRIKILTALAHQEMCVCDIAVFLGISESAVSHQLRYLRNVRLVKNRREKTTLYYRLVDDKIIEIIDLGRKHIRDLQTRGT